MSESQEDVKTLVLMLLGHDRWNSGLSDERLAEKIAVMLSGRGLIGPEPGKAASPPPAAA
jgi:hypothetical protein